MRYRKIVIKIGTSVIASTSTFLLDRSRMRSLVDQVSKLMKKGHQVVLVSSGAIGAGMGLLGLKKRPKSLPDLQACAAVGQGQLMKIYGQLFKKEGYLTAQMLLTQEDMDARLRFLNAKNTLMSIIDRSIIPIINENDTVSTDEIRFGDNDRLSALVADMSEADLLILLSDVDNLFRFDESGKKPVETIYEVREITKDLEALVVKGAGCLGVGGMATKIDAAKVVTSSGIPCVIASGRRKDILAKILSDQKVGTRFFAKEKRTVARKRWIAHFSRAQGIVKVDAGAKSALIERGKSLLAKGVTGISGRFETGDVIRIADTAGHEFARGLSNYSSSEIHKIQGKHTSQIEEILGYKDYDEVIHRDNLVLLT
ncbi:MAG: glutamate 5-kinase [Candidatus Omnitrophica bacterium]|nr:glutamate 5-kinase [Candidatus Omnitrophota bacterium]